MFVSLFFLYSYYFSFLCDSFFPLFTTVNFAVVAFACHQAIQARDIKSEFSESKYIGLSVFSMFQGFLTGIPIVAVVRDIPRAFYLVLTFVIFILCMVVLLLIFLPKMLMQRRYAGKSKADQKKLMSMAISVRKSSARLQTTPHNTNTIIAGSGYGGVGVPNVTAAYAAAARGVHNGSSSEHMQRQDPHIGQHHCMTDLQIRVSDLDPNVSVSFEPTSSSSARDNVTARNSSSSPIGTPSMQSSAVVSRNNNNESQWSRPVLSSNKTESTADPSIVSSQYLVPGAATDGSSNKESKESSHADSTTASGQQSSEEATLLFRQLLALTKDSHNSTSLEGVLRLVDRNALTESERRVLDGGLCYPT
jgi:hypothetical protein